MPQEGFVYGDNGFYGPCLIWLFTGAGYTKLAGRGKGYAKVFPDKEVLAQCMSNGKTNFCIPISADMNPKVEIRPTKTSNTGSTDKSKALVLPKRETS